MRSESRCRTMKREGKKREEGHAQRQTQREREREEARRERTKQRAGATVIRSAGENYPAVIYDPPSDGAGPKA